MFETADQFTHYSLLELHGIDWSHSPWFIGESPASKYDSFKASTMFRITPKKNISIWCREISPWISPWISQCWFNELFSGPGGYQVGFIDPMTNISKKCNMSVGKTQKKKQQHIYIYTYIYIYMCVLLYLAINQAFLAKVLYRIHKSWPSPKRLRNLRPTLAESLAESEATWGPETFLWPNFGFWPTNMVT